MDSAQTSVTITVDPANDPPQADDISVNTEEDVPVAISLSGSDVDGDSLAYTLVSGPNNGVLTGTAPNYTYSPNSNFYGPDTFSFTVNDGLLDSEEAVVTILVNPVNDIPTANGQSVVTDEDVAVAITLTGSDVDGDILTYQIVSGPGNGILSGTPPSITYVPNKHFNGSDSFDFQLNDSILDSAIATVSITVNPLNDAPMASAGSNQQVFVGDPVTLDGSGSTDGDGDFLTYTWSFVSIPEMSTATLPVDPLLANPTFVPDVAGLYVVRLIVNDGIVDSNPDDVEITAEAPPVTVEPQPEGPFGEQYQDLIPPDATAASYDPERFAVVTGLVQNLGGEALPDVPVGVLGHPEYGTAVTDSSGRFSLPVEGGATSTVVYQKTGLISAQRQVYVPWNDTAVAETVQMISEDSASTTVTFDGNPATVFTHGSSKVDTISQGTEAISYGYDGSLVTAENFNGTLNESLNYTYDNDFNLTTCTYAGGTVGYNYDLGGLLTGSGVFIVSRNVGNGLPEAVTGGALNLSRTFNGYGEVEGQDFIVGGEGVTSWSLIRDSSGMITSKTGSVAGVTSNYIYSYDPMGRLITVSKDNTLVEEYHYDNVGPVHTR